MATFSDEQLRQFASLLAPLQEQITHQGVMLQKQGTFLCLLTERHIRCRMPGGGHSPRHTALSLAPC